MTKILKKTKFIVTMLVFICIVSSSICVFAVTDINGNTYPDTKYISVSHDNLRTQYYNANGQLINTTFSWGNSSDHPSVHAIYAYRDVIIYTTDYEVPGAYYLTYDEYALPKTSNSSSTPVRYNNSDGSYRIETRFTAYYSGYADWSTTNDPFLQEGSQIVDW